MKRRLKIALLILFIAVVVGFTVYMLANKNSPETTLATPHYLVYNGQPTKIYLIDTETSYTNTNQTYTTPEGQNVEKGTPLFVITMTLRNDYTSDNPAPPLQNQDQTSPADGTAYLYLTAQLYDKNGQLNAPNVSVSDFSLPAVSGTGLVLSSGETAPVNICIATSQTNINKYIVNLYLVSDSIPASNT